jgi:hypothetical protein
MQRRQFIVAAGGLIAAGAGALGPAVAAPADAPDIALYDGRFEDVRWFGEALRRRGAAAFDTRADLARLWYGPLQRAFDGGRRPRIAGLATWADFVVARGLAREARLTLVRHELHDRARPDWPRTLAALSGGALPDSTVPAQRSGMLVSWVIS